MPHIHPGDIYGSLIVLDYSGRYKRWRCQCSCGTILYRSSTDLTPRTRCRECWLRSKEYNKFRLSINPQPEPHPLSSSTSCSTGCCTGQSPTPAGSSPSKYVWPQRKRRPV